MPCELPVIWPILVLLQSIVMFVILRHKAAFYYSRGFEDGIRGARVMPELSKTSRGKNEPIL